MKKLLFLCACLVALCSSPVLAQAGGPSVAVVREYVTGIGSGHLVIDRDGKLEKIDFNLSGATTGVENNTEAIRQAVSKLYQEGYSLKASLGAQTLIFVKSQ